MPSKLFQFEKKQKEIFQADMLDIGLTSHASRERHGSGVNMRVKLKFLP